MAGNGQFQCLGLLWTFMVYHRLWEHQLTATAPRMLQSSLTCLLFFPRGLRPFRCFDSISQFQVVNRSGDDGDSVKLPNCERINFQPSCNCSHIANDMNVLQYLETGKQNYSVPHSRHLKMQSKSSDKRDSADSFNQMPRMKHLWQWKILKLTQKEVCTRARRTWSG